MNNELIELLTKLEENTNLILTENKRLEDEIKALKGEILNYLDCTNIGINSVFRRHIKNTAGFLTESGGVVPSSCSL